MTDPVVLARLAAIEARLAAIEARGATTPAATQNAPQAPGRVATDRELDDPQYGDQIVRSDPKRWSGESFAGRRWSDCSPEFLDMLAGLYDWHAENERTTPGKERFARISESRAACARGWAKRIRSRPATPDDDSDVPF